MVGKCMSCYEEREYLVTEKTKSFKKLLQQFEFHVEDFEEICPKCMLKKFKSAIFIHRDFTCRSCGNIINIGEAFLWTPDDEHMCKKCYSAIVREHEME